MFLLSAFADEISPDPNEQLDVLEQCGIRHIELRSIHKTNVLALSDLQVEELRSLLRKRGFRLSAIGSPIGKTKIDQAFDAVLKQLDRAIALCTFFEAKKIRIFSYYLPEGETWPKWRDEVLRRMREKAERAERAGVMLVHENEHAIYGDDPDRVVDLFTQVKSPAFRAVYDPANYVFCGYDPWQGWEKTKAWTSHFHIKDWTAGEKHGRLAGEGQGRVVDVLAEAHAAGYEGFATLEPHLLGGGPTGGVTGPELFPKAANALKEILQRLGAHYQ